PFQDDITIDFSITPSVSITVKEVLRVGHSKDDYYYINNPNTYKTVKEEYVSSYKIPTRLYFDNNGCYINLRFINQSGKVIDEKGWTIKPVTDSIDLNPEEHVNDPYVAYNCQTSIRNEIALPIEEKFQFPDYIDYFNIDVYHRLDLNSLSFKYSSAASFKYGSCSLTYYDFDGVFPYLEHDEEHKVTIPLSLSISNQKAVFSYRDIMYVNSKTLQMSLKEKEGFVKTRFFYLPVNKKEKLLEEKMYVDLKEAGLSKNDIHWELTYLANRNVVGDCDDSDYCVVEDENA
nr:hypothetical protein [Bacilli bacterium]